MDRREGQIYKKKLDDFLDKILRAETWTKAIQRLLIYKVPHCTSLQFLKIADAKNIFVGASFIKCGRQDYMV